MGKEETGRSHRGARAKSSVTAGGEGVHGLYSRWWRNRHGRPLVVVSIALLCLLGSSALPCYRVHFILLCFLVCYARPFLAVLKCLVASVLASNRTHTSSPILHAQYFDKVAGGGQSLRFLNDFLADLYKFKKGFTSKENAAILFERYAGDFKKSTMSAIFDKQKAALDVVKEHAYQEIKEIFDPVSGEGKELIEKDHFQGFLGDQEIHNEFLEVMWAARQKVGMDGEFLSLARGSGGGQREREREREREKE